MNEHEKTEQSTTPPELHGIESALDRLGARERASAPAGLEDRVLAGVRATLDAPPRSIPIHRHRAGSRGGLGRRLGAIAAAVAVVGGAWIALIATRSPEPTTMAGPEIRAVSLEAGVEDLLALEALLDEMQSVDTTAAQDEADEIDSMIGSPWDLMDTLDAAIGEEAI